MSDTPPSAQGAARSLAIPVPVSRSYSQQSHQTTRTQVTTHEVATAKKVALRRRILGLALLCCTVILWTASGFLQSSIFADSTYSHPYFVTYFDTSFFIISFLPFAIKNLAPPKAKRWLEKHTSAPDTSTAAYTPLANDHPQESNHLPPWSSGTPILIKTDSSTHPRHLDGTFSPISNYSGNDLENTTDLTVPISPTDNTLPPLTTRETFLLSLKFALLWFIANYFNSACLHFTTVASVTILSSTSSIFTLIFGAFTGVEHFTLRKLLGVLACLAGVVLTSGIDVSEGNSTDRGKFPSKTSKELAIGDALALTAAVLYGIYSVALVKTVGDESRIRMPVFFGFLGLINVAVLWPGFFILHYAGVESFSLPPTGRIWGIIVINAASSLISDVCWAYAVLFTGPLVVTVGLSLTIPLSLVGQMVLEDEYVSAMYFVGAAVVVAGFLIVNWDMGGDGLAEVSEVEVR